MRCRCAACRDIPRGVAIRAPESGPLFLNACSIRAEASIGNSLLDCQPIVNRKQILLSTKQPRSGPHTPHS
jgi:hypothetical protein